MTGVTERGGRRGRGWPVAVAAGFVVAAALAAGVLVWGRVADTPTAAMVLTTAWFGVVFVSAALVARRRRWLLLPLAAGYGVAAIATGVLVAVPSVVGRTVNDADVAGVAVAVPAGSTPAGSTPAGSAPAGSAPAGSAPAGSTPAGSTPAGSTSAGQAGSRASVPAGPARPVEVGRAGLVGIDHTAAGTARLIRLADGSLLVRLERFEVQPGPDYYVHVLPGADGRRPVASSQVARLRGTSGNQNYPLAAGRQVALPATVLIWCRTFDTPIAAATIR
jgi:hypothetical protein